MNRKSPRVFAIVVAATSALAVASGTGAPAGAAGPGAPSPSRIGDGWKKLTSNLGDTGQIGLARGRDGVLHVLWVTGSLPGHYRIWDTAVSARGTVRARVAVTPLLNFPGTPDIVATPHGVDAFWLDANSDVYQADRPVSGGKWHADLSQPVLTGDPYGGMIGATVAVDGTPWIAFSDGNDCGGFCVDRVGSPQVRVATPGNRGLSSTSLAVDGRRGTKWLGYVALRGARNTGLYVQKLTSGGKAAGPAVRLPDTSGLFSVDQRLPLTGRGKGRAGVFAAYIGVQHGIKPCAVHVFRLGATKARTLGTDSACSSAAAYVAADPNGRLWVFWGVWSDHTPIATLYYRRSNSGATAWGPLEHVSFPQNVSILSVLANAQAGRVDVVALLGPSNEFFTRQIIVRLGLSARISGKTVTFDVTDQGTPVRGSTIRFCGASKATSASGRSSFTIRTPGRGHATATVSMATYHSAHLTIKATC